MTIATSTAPSSQDLEAQALQALYREWRYWVSENLDPDDFTDDVAISILHENGIPACRLGCDLQMLVGQAHWMARGGNHAVRH